MPKSGRGQSRYWITIAAGFIVTGFGLGLFGNCHSAFIRPVSESLGFSRGEFSIYLTLSSLVGMLLLPFYGSLFKRYGIKRFMLMGTVVCSIVPALYSFSTKLWQFYAVSVLNGLFVTGITVLAVGTLMSNWFKDKKGIATGVALSGSGLVSAVMIPILTGIIENYGWQWAYRTMSLVGFLCLMPVVLFMVVDHPEDIGLDKYSSSSMQVSAAAEPAVAAEQTGLTRGEALKTPSLWFVMLAFSSLSFLVVGLSNHTISYLTDIGHTPMQASASHSTYLFSLVFTKILIGIIADRFGPYTAVMISGMGCIAMPVMALFAHLPYVPPVYGVIVAIAASAGSVLPSLIAARYFGEKDFASIYSLCTMSAQIGSAFGSPAVGFAFDYYGSYIPAIYFCIVIGVVVVAAHTVAYRLRPVLG